MNSSNITEISDLRIGNFFSLHGEIVELGADLDTKDCKPLRITEEWLTEFGFKDGALKIGYAIYNLELIKGRKISFQLSKNKRPKKIIKYIHELQNAMLALSKKELEMI
jgi:hypothetical protein